MVNLAGVGLNLCAATHVIHFDRSYNPAKESQATDRAHRMGQKKVVCVHKLVSKGSFEERLDRIVKDKAALGDVIDGMDANFISNAKEMMPELRSGNEIAVTTFSAVSKSFIAEQSSIIKAYFRDYFKTNDLQFTIDLEIDASNDEKPKQFLTPKEQFNEMAKENPSLFDFQKRFDLDIDYEN